MYSHSPTLAPLPTVLQHGLRAVAALAFLSLVSSFALFVYLSGRLVAWYVRSNPKNPQREAENGTRGALPCEVGAQYFGAADQGRKAPNQALVLVINVLFADVLQACAFFLNIVWVIEDRITDESPACWAQGWFISTGDLSSLTFLTAIAVHTYITLILGRKVPTKVFYAVISFLWFAVLFLSVLGVIITNNGKGVGGFYVRDTAWCWISAAYEPMRFYLHYLWMVILQVVGTVSWVLVFVHFYRRAKALKLSKKSGEESSSNNSVLSPTGVAPRTPKGVKAEMHKRVLFLLYPLIFLICTTPLAVGRMMGTRGVKLSPEYLCFAGAMITSNGWLDVILFSTTRRAILFHTSPDDQNLGIETFNLTPLGQQFGHRVWITSGSKKKQNERKNGVFRKPSRCPRRGSAGSHDRSESMTSLHKRDLAGLKGIQMETVTRVFVEVESPSEENGYPSGSLASMPSAESVGPRVPQSMDIAYSSSIATAAIEAQRLDASPSFKLTRMTWIKPSWTWMLYRAGYSYKDPGQERILALKMPREYFIGLLLKGRLSHAAVAQDGEKVRIQWDPERTVRLDKLPYRSIQIGIPVGICKTWVKEGIVGIEDVTGRARELKRVLDENPTISDRELAKLGLMPSEEEFVVPGDVQGILEMTPAQGS
ncbi:hypothetical protein KHU50_012467 [Colletotrichum sp. SAR 10_65]|nr:hypothetical protein KHU50_012467 [Colletotrichum sp. SAR 10_65]